MHLVISFSDDVINIEWTLLKFVLIPTFTVMNVSDKGCLGHDMLRVVWAMDSLYDGFGTWLKHDVISYD